MKKLTLFIFGIISTLCVDAQILPFDVEVPNVKFIKSKNGVNIRQQPSVNSKKLIGDYEDPEYGEEIVKWSSSIPKGYMAFQFKFGVAIQEQGGWYLIENRSFIDPRWNWDGWVSAKYCEIFTPEPIEYPKKNYKKEECYMPGLKWIIGDKDYKEGEYVLILEGSYEMDSFCHLNICLGKLKDGFIVCPFEFPIELDWDSYFWENGDNNFHIKAKSMKNSFGNNWYVIPPKYKDQNFSWADYTISDSFVNDLLTKVEPEKLKTPRIYYLYNGCLYSSDSPELF